jgi:hypothetical protein
MRKYLILVSTLVLVAATGSFPVQASNYPYVVGLPCAAERSTVPDELKNPMICTKIGSVKIWRSSSKNAFVLTHAVVGDVYMHSLTPHFKPSLILKAGTFKYSLDSKKGSPPTGLKVNNAGILSGIPTKVSSSRFTICAQDTKGKKDCRPFSLMVDPATVTGTWEGTFTLNEETMIDSTNYCGNTHTGKIFIYIRQVGDLVTGEQVFSSAGLVSENTFNRSLDCLPGFSDFYIHRISGTVDNNLKVNFTNFLGYEPFEVSASSKVMNGKAIGSFGGEVGIVILQTGPSSSEVRKGPISTSATLTFNLRKVSNWASMVPEVPPPSSK